MAIDLILDIRSYPEYEAGHLPQAIHVPTPLPPLEPREICNLTNKLDRILAIYGDEPHYGVYCAKGNRSRLAYALLKALGVKQVSNLGGLEKNSNLSKRLTTQGIIFPERKYSSY